MQWTLGKLFLATAVCAIGLLCANLASAADDTKDKPVIKGGIEGTVKSVDPENKKLTILTSQGRERTFNITDDTILMGPRGGKVRKHLHDPRFREGFDVTVVATGNTATEVHLGFSKRGDATKTAQPADTTKAGERSIGRRPVRTSTPPAATGTTGSDAGKQAEEEDEQEFPGTIKSYDATRRILVIHLLNGKEKSFLLAKDVPVNVKGAVSTRGLADPALKAGAHVDVMTDDSGRKVKELKIVTRLRKAG
jgi:hypothetical protein